MVRRRSSYDPVLVLKHPSYLSTADMTGRILTWMPIDEHTDRRAFFSEVVATTRRAGWTVEEPRSGAIDFFCHDDLERRHVALLPRPPSNPLREWPLPAPSSSIEECVRRGANEMPARVIYLDHNIIHYCSSSFPKEWDAALEQTALEKIHGQSAKFAISLAGFAEAGQSTSSAELYIEFLERLPLLFFSDRVAIQRVELEQFLWKRQFERTPLKTVREVALNSHLSQALSTVPGMSELPLIGYTLAHLIRHLASHARDRDRINAAKPVIPKAIRANESARAKDPRALDSPERLRLWLQDLIPERDPDGRPLSVPDRASLLTFCITHFTELTLECPSLAVEHYLTDFRSSQPARTPSPSDAIDYQNLALGLAYCDFFVSNDGFVQATAEFCRRKCGIRLAKPVRRLSEVIADLQGD